MKKEQTWFDQMQMLCEEFAAEEEDDEKYEKLRELLLDHVNWEYFLDNKFTPQQALKLLKPRIASMLMWEQS